MPKTTPASHPHSLLQPEFGFRSWSRHPLLMTKPHRHNDIELNLVESGACAYVFAGRTLHIKAGQMLVFWASAPHQMTYIEPRTHMHWLTLPLGWLLHRQLPAALTSALLRGTPLVCACQQRDFDDLTAWQSDLQAGGERWSIALLELEARLRRLALQSDAFASAAKALPDVGGKAERMARLITDRHAEKLKVETLARLVHLHPNYAMAVFRKTFGVSITEYLTQVRVMQSQQLLATSDLSVLTIALRCGFGSSSQFYSVFKRICGQTPLAYRRSLTG